MTNNLLKTREEYGDLINTEPNRREFKMYDKIVVHQRKDPYGFIKIGFKSGGRVPDDLSGEYTSFHESEKAMRAHYTARGERIKNEIVPKVDVTLGKSHKQSEG